MSGIDAATEMFALVDVLVDQPMLRRALSDPEAEPAARVQLGRRLFSSKVGDEAMAALDRSVQASWRESRGLIRAVEAEGVKSALQAAEAAGALRVVASELHTIGGAVASSADLTISLRSASFTSDAKRALIVRLVGDQAHPVTKLLAARAVTGQERRFSKNVDAYLKMAADLCESVIANVTVAKPLDQNRVERLRRALSARTGKPVVVQIDVDPSVIGGMRVAIGDEVYESTVARRIEDVRRQLINS